MTDQRNQPYLDTSVELTARQQTLLAICDAHWIVVGDDSTATGEDAGEYFATIERSPKHGQHPARLPATSQPGRYCALTTHDDSFFAIADFETLEAAQERAVEHMADDIFAEQPVAILDLDTGQRWDAVPTATWAQRQTTAAVGAH
jgi:hypothetical protein